jgi:dihydropteroate synthase
MQAKIMAIINTSPDSFSGDGLNSRDEAAVRNRLQIALDEGAEILDIGGQSTRPGAEIIDEQEEIARVVPVLHLARELAPDMPLSVDTFKPTVARAALEAGATIINDVTGFRDKEMIGCAVQADCDIVVMHMRGTPQTMSSLTSYPGGVVEEVRAFLYQRAEELVAAGVAPKRIILDPGIGFAKTPAQSFELTRRLGELCKDDFRILYGASNKSFIGKALAHHGEMAPVGDRAVGTVVVQAHALMQGAAIIRVHDVKAAVQTRTIVEALQKGTSA